jgi:hypothetical protein
MIAGTHYELQYDALNIESIIRRRTGQPAPWLQQGFCAAGFAHHLIWCTSTLMLFAASSTLQLLVIQCPYYRVPRSKPQRQHACAVLCRSGVGQPPQRCTALVVNNTLQSPSC